MIHSTRIWNPLKDIRWKYLREEKFSGTFIYSKNDHCDDRVSDIADTIMSYDKELQEVKEEGKRGLYSSYWMTTTTKN